MLFAAESAQGRGAKIALVTSAVISPLSRLADHRILLLPPFIPPETAHSNAALIREIRGLFEQSAYLYFARLAQFLDSHSGQSPDELERRRPE
jgi:DNA-binding MurR/RpiR family transcriptional regulator